MAVGAWPAQLGEHTWEVLTALGLTEDELIGATETDANQNEDQRP